MRSSAVPDSRRSGTGIGHSRLPNNVPALNSKTEDQVRGQGGCCQDNRAVGNSRLAPKDGLSVS